MHRILIVEDDPAIRKVLTVLFESNGFDTRSAETCTLALHEAQSREPDVCIVDLGLPDRDGTVFIQQMRVRSPVSIIVLSARQDEAQRLTAFEAGADDYVIKPFSSPELLARVRAMLRRSIPGNEPSAVLRLGSAFVDLRNRVTRGPTGDDVKLTPLEHRILECLVRHGGGVVTHAQILKEVWGAMETDVRSVRVYVASLRRKLEVDPTRPKHILTESGVGYRLATDIDTMDSRTGDSNER